MPRRHFFPDRKKNYQNDESDNQTKQHGLHRILIPPPLGDDRPSDNDGADSIEKIAHNKPYANINIMLPFQQMLLRFAIALVLGAILGVERELVGKEAGVRTEMVVAAGASIFAMIGLALPYIITSPGMAPDAKALTDGIAVIANIVSGIGFLGAGLIIKMNSHPHGVTTAALVWVTAAIGTLVGIGLVGFAVSATVLVEILLYTLRKMRVSEKLEKQAKAGAGAKEA